jgi:acetyl-CoA acetyltransferase
VVRDQTAIVGIGQTEYVRRIGRSESETALEAARAALADAGLRGADVDAIFAYENQTGSPEELARRLGSPNLRCFSVIGGGGGAACAPVVHAAIAISSGVCEVALAYRARNRGAVGGRPWAKTEDRVGGRSAFESPYGLVNPVHTQALVARRYVHEFGCPPEAFARVAVAQRAHAVSNPNAWFRTPITVDDVLGSRMIADPLHLLECCPENDGAAAVIVTSAERARDLRQRPAIIAGVAQGTGPRHFPMTNLYKRDLWDWPGAHAARDLYRMAGLGPEDVDVVEMYDMFAPVVLYGLEAYGFCKRGEAGARVCKGWIDGVDAELPTNTHGGSLSEAYIHGFNHILEGVRQIRGTSSSQVSGAEVVLVAAAPLVPTSAVLLRR